MAEIKSWECEKHKTTLFTSQDIVTSRWIMRAENITGKDAVLTPAKNG